MLRKLSAILNKTFDLQLRIILLRKLSAILNKTFDSQLRIILLRKLSAILNKTFDLQLRDDFYNFQTKKINIKMEPTTGIEPVTSALPRRRSAD